MVAGHAPLREGPTAPPPGHLERDGAWVLSPFQAGEPPFFVEHLRRGAVLAAHDPSALLVISGGRSRPESTRTEAESYRTVAAAHRWWGAKVPVALEEYARDSFENLAYSLCRFHQVTGAWPGLVTVVSWAFKGARFDLHRQALRWPDGGFRFDGPNDPLDLAAALAGEAAAAAPWGVPATRRRRTFGPRAHGYGEVDGMAQLVGALEAPSPDGHPELTEPFPWEA